MNISFSELKRIIFEDTALDDESPSQRSRRLSITTFDDEDENQIELSDVTDNVNGFDYDLGFRFLKKFDTDTLRVELKNRLRKKGEPFRDLDKAKAYFDHLPKYSDERIEYEEMIRELCSDYIEDIDPEEYDDRERSRTSMNNYMMGMMMGLIREASEYCGMPAADRVRFDEYGHKYNPMSFYEDFLMEDAVKHAEEVRSMLDSSVKVDYKVSEDSSCWPYFVEIKLETPDGRKWMIDFGSVLEYTDVQPDGKYVFADVDHGDPPDRWEEASRIGKAEIAKYAKDGADGVEKIIDVVYAWNDEFDEAFQELKTAEEYYGD